MTGPAQEPPHDPAAPGWGPPPGSGPVRTEDTLWAVLAHLSIFVFSLVGPLAIYLVLKDRSPFTRQHAAEALNFHLTLLIATAVSGVLVLVLVGIVLLLAVAVFGMVFGVLAAVAAGNGRPYRYPLTLRFVS